MTNRTRTSSKLLLVILLISSSGRPVSGQDGGKCGLDSYYDQFTRNCEPCRLLCDEARGTVDECREKCPDYLAKQLTEAERTEQTTIPTHRHRHPGGTHSGEAFPEDGEIILSHYEVMLGYLILAAVIFALVAAIVVMAIALCRLNGRPQTRGSDIEKAMISLAPSLQGGILHRDTPDGDDDNQTAPGTPVQTLARHHSRDALCADTALRQQQEHDEGRRSPEEQAA
ncbi:Hypp2671 [Branchiostoma lanceolatum]|uniref:Hypp2671 protein n=1 Tax=Branchiostoma lanceolatum TaxID=7740 RepID=A0A8K0EP36_BRALA|nr:Hypp2671 [Branchiostoma lanceolatum]